MSDLHFMRLALDLAELGNPATRPNPLVGAILVLNGKILGQGYHRQYGAAHAEVEAVNDARKNGATEVDIAHAVLYVTLEPCSHYGKTPPCAELIVKSGIKNVVIACLDPNPKVNGQGVQKLQESGVSVVRGVMEKEAKEINRKFFTFHEKKRPYVILKWAQTADGFIARKDYSSKWISSEKSRALVHQWRDEEMAVMIGTNTAVYDNPMLTARIPNGRNPIRILVDRTQRVPTSFNMFDEVAPAIVYNDSEDFTKDCLTLVKIDFDENLVSSILSDLYNRGIQSLLVEGGSRLLSSFLESGLWDEARIFTSQKTFGEGIAAPRILVEREVLEMIRPEDLDGDHLEVLKNVR